MRDPEQVPPPIGRDETELERLDRELIELLTELRVALPGVQVLFAFLLIVPFSTRFETLSAFDRDLYYGTLVCAAAASLFLIAPTAYHRITFRYQDKPALVPTANRYAIVGLTFLALSMNGVVLLVTDVLYGTAVTIGAGVAIFAVSFVLWYALPLRRRRQRARERADRDA